jgi:tight adherence protein B
VGSQLAAPPLGVVAGLAAWVGWQLGGGRTLVLLGGAVMLVWAARRLIQTSRERHERSTRRAQVVELCDALAAELAAGLPASLAAERACATWDELRDVVHSARLGDNLAVALRRQAVALPGAEGLRSIAAAWEVAERSGAALVIVLSKVAEGLRTDEEARDEVTAALGPPRATAKMLAVLPLFGLTLGASMGADPLGFLLGSPPGLLCLAIGCGLALVGLWWVERLASAVESRS